MPPRRYLEYRSLHTACQVDANRGRMALLAKKKAGAGNETRTRDHYLGKVVLYQLSYARSTMVANK
jgi:hypothetical protein